MSWGERSCTGNGCRSHKVECEIQTCNVDCLGYEWDGKTKPDSISHKQVEKIATKEEAEIVGGAKMTSQLPWKVGYCVEFTCCPYFGELVNYPFNKFTTTISLDKLQQALQSAEE